MSTPNQVAHRGPIRLPKPHSGIGSIEQLREHLQFAIQVELSTIPLYLYGMYSVDTQTHDGATVFYGAVRPVVVEEMLHLILAGNTLLAIGGAPKLYDYDVIPLYPSFMLFRTPNLLLSLRELTKDNLQTFIDIETPETCPAPPEPDEYETIGQFYKAIEVGLVAMDLLHPDLFNNDTGAQFTPNDDMPSKDDIIEVTSLDSALTALRKIVTQGEGKPCDDSIQDKNEGEQDHYHIFLGLKEKTWDVLPVMTDPTTHRYSRLDAKIHTVSLVVDASFCYLLLTIEMLWSVSPGSHRTNLLGNISPLMIDILGPLAQLLLTQQIGDKVAAPCFNYYHFESTATALSHLQNEIQGAIDAYDGDDAQGKLQNVRKKISELADITADQ